MPTLMTASTLCPRRALLPAERCDQVEAILGEIAEALWERRATLDPSLASGLAGAALFLGHLSRRPGWASQMPRSLELLAMAVARIERAPSASLFSGFSGIAWCVEHLRKGLIPFEEEDPNRDVDELIWHVLDAETWYGGYDLISGLVGLGVYALERLPLPSGRALLARLVQHLEHLAIPRGPGLTWPTAPETLPDWQQELCPAGYLNLGLAHGVPGVLAFLAAVRAQGIEPDRCDRLLDQGMAGLRWFLQDEATGSFLPAWCPMDQERPESSATRLAWGYGDLGVSVALWQAGPASWRQEALAMARLAAARPQEQAGVKDAGLCHGSAGLLHLFNHWYQATGDPLFRAQALQYLDLTLQFRDPERGFAGFWSRALPTEEHPDAFDPCPGLLEGAAGVGLALLSSLGGAAPSWDRMLLLSPLEPFW